MAKKNSGYGSLPYHQIMMQQAMQKANEPVYCRYCGKNINEPTKESRFSESYASEWEIRNNAHSSCYQRHYRG